ncbi:MAG: hypothetical protein II633_06375, partial [Bacteroidales bacterium]|nr:hypothetical protein [Bacteroidales bacterium]
ESPQDFLHYDTHLYFPDSPHIKRGRSHSVATPKKEVAPIRSRPLFMRGFFETLLHLGIESGTFSALDFRNGTESLPLRGN